MAPQVLDGAAAQARRGWGCLALRESSPLLVLATCRGWLDVASDVVPLRLPADALRELGRLYRCVMVVATQQYLTSLRNLTKC